MSSLAGALDDRTQSNPRYIPNKSQAIPMDPPSDRDEDEDMDDLFGNDNDVEDYGGDRKSPSPTASGHDSERLPSPERERRQALEYGEDDAPQEVAYEVKEAEVRFPNIPVPRSSDGDKWVIRTPNFVQMDPKPFHPDTYTGPEQDDDDATAENVKERSMTIKLKVENTMRWRWTKDENAQDRQQSNSRIIRWSDGSLSLRLGKELFDITKSIDTSAAAPRQLGGSQPASQSQTPSVKNQGLTYLVAQHKRSQVLQAEAVITGTMSLRPTGMQSETHRMLVRAVGQKHNKVARLKIVRDPVVDPEREKTELVKQSNRKARRRGENEEGLGGGRRRKYSRRNGGQDVWSDDDDDFAGVFGSEDENEDGSSPRKAKRKAGADEERGGYQEDDFLVADSDDDDGYRKKKRRSGNGYDDDPLDKLDAKIEAQQRRTGDVDTDDEKQMDVESEEEDEEDLPVRRTTGGTRRRAVNFDDEEEE